jgi:hypothetical protein
LFFTLNGRLFGSFTEFGALDDTLDDTEPDCDSPSEGSSNGAGLTWEKIVAEAVEEDESYSYGGYGADYNAMYEQLEAKMLGEKGGGGFKQHEFFFSPPIAFVEVEMGYSDLYLRRDYVPEELESDDEEEYGDLDTVMWPLDLGYQLMASLYPQ